MYDIVQGEQHDSHIRNLDCVQDLKNSRETPIEKKCNTIEDVIDFLSSVLRSRKRISLLKIDGVVIKVDSLKQRERLGMTMKSPRWATAWKFKAVKAKSQLLSVENSIGRTGIFDARSQSYACSIAWHRGLNEPLCIIIKQIQRLGNL